MHASNPLIGFILERREAPAACRRGLPQFIKEPDELLKRSEGSLLPATRKTKAEGGNEGLYQERAASTSAPL